MKTQMGLLFIMLLVGPVWAADDNCTAAKKQAVCTDQSVKDSVDWACQLVEAKGTGAIPEINAMRFDCCGEPDYVWLNDMEPKMIVHPIKPALNGQSLKDSKDPDGKKLFVEFVNAVKKTPTGAWVNYKWAKFGESIATPKKSWVKACKVGTTGGTWVVGSGTWE